MNRNTLAAGCFLMLFGIATASADITDFNEWTLVEDPPHANFSSSVDSASQVTLSANGGSIPHGTDIGYNTINGSSPGTSSQGYFFDPANDFSIAVDYNMGFSNTPLGTLAFGFGIGESTSGSNSAGVALVTNSGLPITFVGGSRINDVDQAPQTIAVPASLSGRMLVSYNAATGDIEVGVSTNGDDVAEGSHVFSGMQNSWTDGGLIPSFFVRSDDVLALPWQSGNSTTIVTNFRVLSGSATAIPEPGSGLVLIGGGLTIGLRRRRR